MRLAKILILSLLAAVSATAVLGAGTASASALCKAEYTSGPCLGEALYEAGTTLKMTLKPETEAVFAGTSTVKCTGSEMKGELEENPTDPVPIPITSLTFSGCKKGLESCEVKSLHISWQGGMESLEGNNGVLRVSGGGSGKPGVTTTCGITKCEYETKAETSELELLGGKPASLVAKEVQIKKTAGSPESCVETLYFSATYRIVEVDEPEAAPVENPAVQAGNTAKINPSPIVWKAAGVQSANFEVFQLGKHSIISQTPSKAAFELIQTCGGQTVTVTDAKKGASCTFQIRVLAGNYAQGETANLLTQWQADGAKNAQNINTTLELK